MTTRISILIIVLVSFLGCQKADSDSAKQNDGSAAVVDESNKPGMHECEMTAKDGTAYTYTLHIPESYDPMGVPAPFAMALHFGGGGKYYGKGIIALQVMPGLRDIEPIIVAPDCLGGGWCNDKNEQMVLEIYEKVMQEYRIDPKRTLITGFSMGGHGTWYVAGRNQDRFRAAIPIAGRPSESVQSWTLPVYAIHSSNDSVVEIGPTRKYVEQMQKANAPMQLVETLIPHFKTDNYKHPLREAVPWLKEVWAQPN